VSTVLYTIYKRKRWYKEKRGRFCGLGMKKKSDVNIKKFEILAMKKF